MRLTWAIFLLCVGSRLASADPTADLTASIGRFSVNLFGSVVQGLSPDNSYILSPLSVLTDLAMALFGAKGQTATELRTGLQLGTRQSQQQIAESFRKLLQPLQSTDSALKVVNKIYVNDKFTVKPQFNALISQNFFATAEPLNFAQSSLAATTINNYVASQTNQLIKDLVDASQFSAATRVVLINAVYFKAQWLYPFEAENTRKETFHLQAKGTDAGNQVDFMHNTKNYRYAELKSLNAVIVGLPYKQGGYVMNVILPNAAGGGGLRQLQSRLQRGDLSKLSAGMAGRTIQLSMPKFETRYKVSLSGPLKKLGIRRAFTGSADFSELLENAPKVEISAVVHEAYIKVDENGTEAAAATAAIISATSAISPDEEKVLVVNLNRPFAYYIEDATHNVVFYGQYAGK